MTERLDLARPLVFPLRDGSLWVLLICPLLIALAMQAGFLGLWLLLVLLYMIGAYGFQLLDAMADGRRDPPVMTGGLQNPFNEGRPVLLLVLIVAGEAIVSVVGRAASDGMAGVVAAGLLLLLPSAVAVLGLRRGAYWVLNPVALVATAFRLGPYYFVCLAAFVLMAALHVVVDALPLLTPVIIFVQLYSLFVVYCVIGASMHARRHELGHEPVVAPERTAAREAADEGRARDAVVDEAYRLCRAEKYKEAYDCVVAVLAAHCTDPAGQIALFRTIVAWDDAWLAVRIAPELVTTLLKANLGLDATDLAEQAMRRDPDFRPTHAGEALRIAREASRTGRLNLARALLGDFDDRYPDAPARALADELRRELADRAL